jgi:hypothetical protein
MGEWGRRGKWKEGSREETTRGGKEELRGRGWEVDT